MTWEYDGSFEGFLSLVAASYDRRTLPEVIRKEAEHRTLFDDALFVPTDESRAHALAAALKKRFARKVFERIFHVFLCDDQPVELDLLLYIRLGFKDTAVFTQLSHPVVYAVEQHQRRLFSTLHRMHGFTRFEQLEDGTLYAKISPPRNVLPLMGRHFIKRFGNERFIIHDLKRSLALMHENGTLALRTVHEADRPKTDAEETMYQELWKRFFDTVAIDERLNPSAQRYFVPKLYRRYMTEFISSPDADSPSLPAAARTLSPM